MKKRLKTFAEFLNEADNINPFEDVVELYKTGKLPTLGDLNDALKEMTPKPSTWLADLLILPLVEEKYQVPLLTQVDLIQM